jgi:glycosyltransferase involved in cell wall biosynthesis
MNRSSSPTQEKYTFTIFIPACNRAHTLGRALESVAAQSYRDFEVLVVDDGSTDNTRDLVAQWQASWEFPIRYHFQENQGKHVAHNTAAQLAQGYFFITLDSDDMLAPNALVEFIDIWNSIPDIDRDRFAGAEGNCIDISGHLVGSAFPAKTIDSDYVETRYRLNVKGDKKNVLRTAVVQMFPYPQFPGERFFRESILWKRIGQKYRTRYVNNPFQVVEYQRDGLSSNPQRLRMNNPRGLSFYYREDVDVHMQGELFHHRYNSAVKYVRFSLHASKGFFHQYSEIKSKQIWLAALPWGTFKWLADCIKYKQGYLGRQ